MDNAEKSEQQELVEDLVQIITVFRCKLQAKQANKARRLVNGLIKVRKTMIKTLRVIISILELSMMG